MKELRLTVYEIKRLFRAKKTWLFVALFAFIPLFLCTDMFGLGNNYSGTMSGVLMLKPAKDAAFAGAFIALIFTLLEMQRMTKNRISAIVDTVTDSVRSQIRQTAAILAVVTVTLMGTLCVLLPYTAVVMSDVFKMAPFLASWGLIYFGAILTVVFLASGLFMITKNANISFVVVGVLILANSFIPIGSNYLFFWIQTRANSFSDATQSVLQIEVILYTRLVWLLLSIGVYITGLASIRRYGNNILRSILLSGRKILLPALAVLFTVCAIYLYCNEPFFDNGPIIKTERSVDPHTGIVIYTYDDSSFIVDESFNKTLQFISGKADVTVDTAHHVLRGEVTYTVRNDSGKEQDVSMCITPGIDFIEVYENDVKITFKKNELDNFMNSVYHLKVPKDNRTALRIVYGGTPKCNRNDQIRQWGITDQYVFIPEVYPVPNAGQRAPMECTLTLPQALTPIMQETVLTEIAPQQSGCKTYTYENVWPMWLFAGEYNIEKLNAGGQVVSFIYLKGREKAIKDSNAAAVVADVVDYFTEKFGPLDFHGMPFTIAELDNSVVDGGWQLGNMSVYGESMYAGAVYKGNPNAPNTEGGAGIGVAVHEIAHLWWGSSPDGVYITEDRISPWSAEGMAVFSTYLYMKDRYGEEYAKQAFTDVWETNTKRMQNAFYLTHLQYVRKLSDTDAADIYSAFASTTRYEMMPYLLLKAEKLVGGEDAFVSALGNISQKYRRQELTYNRFLKELGLTKEDMTID